MKRRNNRIAHLLAIALGSLFIALPAQADVVGSKHDLTTATGAAFSTTGDTANVCVFCHTPHGASATSRPLWNRAASAAAYTMYDSTFSTTIDMTVAGTPQGVSAACLTCHDGTLAFDQLVNGPTLASGAYDYNAAAPSRGYIFTGNNNLAGQPVVDVGTDLTNDHPISITYDPTLDTAFNAAAAGKVGALPLYSGRVECGTCHNPHQTATPPFLRMSNAASAICTTCHIK